MIIIIIILILLAILLLVFKVQISFTSIFRRGKYLSNSVYGLRDISGPQGCGKTSFMIHKLKQYENKFILYANIKNISNLNYTYFSGFKGLTEIVSQIDSYNHNNPNNNLKYCICYDELFTEIQKQSKATKDIIKILCQLRKRRIILLTSCQSFPELPLWFRRLCKFEIEIHNFPLLTGSYFLAIYKDGYKLKWDEIAQDFVAPIVVTKIEKVNKKIIQSYNTNEVISDSSFLDMSCNIVNGKTE